MKNRIVTNSLRNIKKSFPRFISLFIMSFLGVFVFSGLQATSPDMLNSLDKYLDDYNTYDFKIISTMGLTNDDINLLKKNKNIKDITGTYSKDVITKLDKEDKVINISSLSKNINKVKLLTGKLPTKQNEIVVEKNLLKQNHLKLNDKLTVNDPSLKEKSFIIAGTVDSSLYFNFTDASSTRGTTSIGTGTINYYSFVNEDAFNISYYQEIFLTINNTKDELTSSKEYKNLIKSTNKNLYKIKSTAEKNRYNKIYNDSLNEIKSKQDELNTKSAETTNKLNNIKNELDKALTKLDNTNNKLLLSKKQLNTAYTTLTNSKKEYQKALQDNNITNLDETITSVETNISNLKNILNNTPSDSSEYHLYQNNLVNLTQKLELLNTLKSSSITISQKEALYYRNLSTYNYSYNLYKTNLDNYNNSLKDYEASLTEFNNKKEALKKELDDATNKLNTIKMPKWYIYTRENYSTYSDYIDDTNSIKNLSLIFPIVFYAVAILVSLISMNRMVEDDRNEIGTLKSLGFSNIEILNKYLLFSLLATLFGGIFGSILGIIIIPNLIFNIYRILFTIPNFILSLNIKTTILGFIISIICVCGTTLLTVMKELKEKPSVLMRPKAPKNGKRVFLEKITFIWKHLSFSKKVTIRNLSRYKKRVIVTLIGIIGCTALILCGFGIKDSIVDIPSTQYGKIFKFDGIAYINNLNEKEINKTFNKKEITNITKVKNLSGTVSNYKVNLFITENNKELSKIINLKDLKTNNKVKLKDNEVIISDKLSTLAKLKVNDTIKITDINNITYNYKISGIIKNYIENYVFINKKTYELSNQEFTPNTIYFNTKKLTNKERDNLTKVILKNDNVINVSYMKVLIDKVSDMLKSLDKVVLILIVLASLLSFVVLYNLSNINIQERKREIATLKVLGFYDNEVDNYITKENIIITLIGIILGLIVGYFLTNIVVGTVEIEKARFIRHIKLNSYIYSALISFIFTIIVNIVNHEQLKRINMIDSLKSVE